MVWQKLLAGCDRLGGPGGLEFFEEAEGGEEGGGDDGFADDGFGKGADPGFVEEVQGDLQWFGQNVEHLLHCIVIGRMERGLKGWRESRT